MTHLPVTLPTMEGSSVLELREFKHQTGWREAWFAHRQNFPVEAVESIHVLGAKLRRENLRLTGADFLGDHVTVSKVVGALHSAGVDAEWPAATMIGRAGAVANQGGMFAHALSGVDVLPVRRHGKPVGVQFSDGDADYCLLQGLIPDDTAGSQGEQTRQVFLQMEEILAGVGMTFHNVIRTWFYLDDILSWYGEFNRVRTQFFTERNVFGGIMPASTGVGCANAAGAALTANVIAVRPRNERVRARRVESPLQCEAYAYGSAFSRALALDTADSKRLYVSGTASIEPGGKTVHLGDTPGQIELTMEVVGAMLEKEQVGWENVTRAIGYFRRPEEIPLWEDFCRRHRFPQLPIVLVQCDVCRDDLLFEIELDAIVGK